MALLLLLQVSLVVASPQCETHSKGNVMLQLGQKTRANVDRRERKESLQGGEVREWEEFAGPFNRVCRGAGPTDNNPAYFEVHQKIPSVEACKDLCVQELGQEGCKGIEYNFLSKRCELWKRKEGIWAFDYPQWEGFTCLRFGWPGKYLIPVTGGLNQACRGPGGQNSESFYVVEAVRHMEDCRARCVASKICRGVEYSKGRCEIWHSEIATTESKTGFECLRYEPPIETEEDTDEPEWAIEPPPPAQPMQKD